MVSGPGPVVAAALPSGPAYTVVLLCHVASALVAMATMVAGIAFALRLLAAGDGPVPKSVRSYFSPGTNWVGRVLYLVPVFGFVLLAMSGGVYQPGSGWVLTGIALWAAATALAEAVLWPAEQRVRRTFAAAHPPVVAAAPTHGSPEAATPVPAAVRQAARRVCLTSTAVLVMLVVAAAVMVAKP